MKNFLKKMAVFFLLFLLTFQSAFAVDNPNYWKKVGSVVELINPAWTIGGTISSAMNQLIDGTLTIDVTDPNAFLVRKNNSGGNVFNVDTTHSLLTTKGSADFKGTEFNFIGVSRPSAAPTLALISPAAAGNVDNGDHKYFITYVATYNGSTTKETSKGTTSSTVTVTNKTVNGKVVLSSIQQSTDPEVTNIKIYRDFNADGVFKLLTTLSAGTTTYTDNTANASLGATYAEPNADEVGKVTAQDLQANRLAIGNNSVFGLGKDSAEPSGTPWANAIVDIDTLQTDFSKSNDFNVAKIYGRLIPDTDVGAGDWDALNVGLIIPSASTKDIYSPLGMSLSIFDNSSSNIGESERGQLSGVEMRGTKSSHVPALIGAELFSVVTGGSSTIDYNEGADIGAGGTHATITDNVVLDLYNLSGATITNNTGLNIEDMTQGTNNTAIKTGLGLVDLGGGLKLNGSLPLFAGALTTQADLAFSSNVSTSASANMYISPPSLANSIGSGIFTTGLAISLPGANTVSLGTGNTIGEISSEYIASPTYSAGAANVVPTAVGLDVSAPSAGTNVTLTNAYGIKVHDVTTGNGVNNYAIQTGLGKVKFGDDLTFGSTGAPKILLYDGGNPAEYGFGIGTGALQIFNGSGSAGGTQLGIWNSGFEEQVKFASNGMQHFISSPLSDFTNPIAFFSETANYGSIGMLDLVDNGGDGSLGGLSINGFGEAQGLQLNGYDIDDGDSGGPAMKFNVAHSTGSPGSIQAMSANGVAFQFANNQATVLVNITGNGKIDANVGGIKTKSCVANVSVAPTAAELVSCFGDAADIGAGFIGTVNDNNANTAQYAVYSNGTSYWYTLMAKAV